MTDHDREVADLREQIAVLEEQLKVATDRAQRWADEVVRLNLLLTRKNEALGVFADPKMWSNPLPLLGASAWNGADAYADPIRFARREMKAEEPTDEGWPG